MQGAALPVAQDVGRQEAFHFPHRGSRGDDVLLRTELTDLPRMEGGSHDRPDVPPRNASKVVYMLSAC